MSAPIAVILAAGKSTRMKSSVPKVLHEVGGRPMIEHVLDAARAAGVERMIVVVGHRAELVREALARHLDLEFVLQAEQKGTGHAVMVCSENLSGHQGPVLVLAGDTPLIRSESLRRLLDELQENGAACVIGTAVTEANQGLGRIVRDGERRFVKIVEQKDATPEEAAITEINTGCYAFDGPSLVAALKQIRPENKQAEYYLTDCPAVLRAEGRPVIASAAFDIHEALGVNTRAQLAEVERALQQAHIQKLMQEGVGFVSPEQVYVDPRAQIGPDTIVYPFTCIIGPAVIGSDCRIGPHAVIQGSLTLADGTVVRAFETVRG